MSDDPSELPDNIKAMSSEETIDLLMRLTRLDERKQMIENHDLEDVEPRPDRLDLG